MSTPRENLLRSMRREGYDRVPVDFQLCDSQLARFRSETGSWDPYEWFQAPVRSVELGLEGAPADWRRWYGPEEITPGTSFDAYGVAHSPGGEGSYHFTRMRHPLKGEIGLDRILDYPFPSLGEAAVADLGSAVERIHAAGLAAKGGMACTVWERAWYLRGMEDLMMDMMAGDERAAALLDRVTELSRRRAVAYARAGCDVIEMGDDIGMQSSIMMSVELWEEWIRPRLAGVVAAARAERPGVLVLYHSCGYVLPFIERLIETGIDILNPVQPESMPFAEVHARFGDRLSFWGTIGTQTTLPFGSPGDVRRAVAENLGACGERGGIVIGPTHVLEPEVPWENFLAMLEAARDYPPSP
jgi:uroporphyrinogen decarboxylase